MGKSLKKKMVGVCILARMAHKLASTTCNTYTRQRIKRKIQDNIK